MRTIDGKTKICGLIGNPVEHTLSPLIHNTLAEVLSENLAYAPFLVQEEGLEMAVKGAFALHVQGLNVTVPYKSRILRHTVALDELAARIGAVNTLVRQQDGYKGYNTDMTGLRRAMLSDGVDIAGRKVVVLGAGGAARAVAFMCAFYKAERVYLLNRTLEKAERIAAEVNESAGRDFVQAMPLADYGRLPAGKFIVIQGTSVGLAPEGERAVIEDVAFYEKVQVGYDLIYRPFQTKFMGLVEAAGGEACNGLKMLLYQGVEAFEHWTGRTVSEALADRVYEEMKKAIT